MSSSHQPAEPRWRLMGCLAMVASAALVVLIVASAIYVWSNL